MILLQLFQTQSPLKAFSFLGFYFHPEPVEHRDPVTGVWNIGAGGAAARLFEFGDGPADSQVTAQEGRLWWGGFASRTSLRQGTCPPQS